MKTTLSVIFFLIGALPAMAQRHELGLLLGRFQPSSRTLNINTAVKAEFTAGTALYANYGIRLTRGERAALYFEVPFVATPQHQVRPSLASLTRDIATIYITPGLRLKLAPNSRISPYVAAGGGLAVFEHSRESFAGTPNPASRVLKRGAFDFGGGVDVQIWRFVGIRGEVRDFISGNPTLNAPIQGSAQHNILVAGGFALRF
jgi:hypothetical protein